MAGVKYVIGGPLMSEMVSPEARGKARDFIRRANVEDDLRFTLLNGFWRGIQRRKDHRPGRRIRPDILEDRHTRGYCLPVGGWPASIPVALRGRVEGQEPRGHRDRCLRAQHATRGARLGR